MANRPNRRSIARRVPRGTFRSTAGSALVASVLALAGCSPPDSAPAGGSSSPDAGAPEAHRRPPSPVEREVLAAVQAFFDAMAAADRDGSAAVLLEGGQYFRIREGSGGAEAVRVLHSDYVASLGDGEDRLLERMWDPTVLVRRELALVWTPYDFFVNGAFSHCGVDAFTLVRAGDRWRIASILYTVEREGCAPGPLGPPGSATPPLETVEVEAREARGPEREVILDHLRSFARALETGDAELGDRLLHPDGVGISVSRPAEDRGSARFELQPAVEFLAWLPTVRGRHSEEFHDEVVLVHGPLAYAWAPYRYRVDGALVACGVNGIALVRGPEGWLGTDRAWTVEREGCGEERGPGAGPVTRAPSPAPGS